MRGWGTCWCSTWDIHWGGFDIGKYRLSVRTHAPRFAKLPQTVAFQDPY